MSPLAWLRNIFSKGQPKQADASILNLQEQVQAWRKANLKMGWDIPQDEFDQQKTIPPAIDSGVEQGFIGTALFYGKIF